MRCRRSLSAAITTACISASTSIRSSEDVSSNTYKRYGSRPQNQFGSVVEDFALADVSQPTVRSFAVRRIVRVAASSRRRAVALAAPAALLALALSLPTSTFASVLPDDPATGYAEAVKACPQPQPGFDRCFALVRKPVAGPAADTEKPGVSPFVVGAGGASGGPAGGLTPADLARA